MNADALAHGYLPELGELIEGKVRDNHIRGGRRFLVATDRISVFDRVLSVLIPDKGAILNGIAMWWFRQTEDIVPNHVVDWPDPNVIVARQADVFPVEVVVRGYLTGSAWRDIESGEFEKKHGFPITSRMVEAGKLMKNCKLKEPIVTPTTKARTGHDEPLTPEQAYALVGDVWDELACKAIELYMRGAKLAEERGLILVDTKYEFGSLDGEIILVDEVHTPDSSRYWLAEEHEPGREMVELSKQFVRDLVQKGSEDLTDQDIEETRRRYIALYEKLTGERWHSPSRGTPIAQRVVSNLSRKGYILGGYVQIISASEEDERTIKLKMELERLKIPHGVGGDEASELIELNKSIEPVVLIALDRQSLGAASRVRFPVISLAEGKGPWPFCSTPRDAAEASERILEASNPLFARRR